LAYDELLANQLTLGLVRLKARKRRGRSLAGDGSLQAKAAAALPYTLTSAQLRSMSEILGDLKSDNRMLRLLQGDVGSGKTVVALLAMLAAVEAGTQAALMAPTEILAQQHFDSLKPYADAAGVRMEVLTSRVKGAAREHLLEDVERGGIKILIGT